MPILHFIVEILFYVVCGWICHVVAKLFTLGKVDMEWGMATGSILAECVGAATLIVVAGSIAWFVKG